MTFLAALCLVAYAFINGFGAWTVLNRKGLEAAACSCYAADRQTYAHLLG